MEQKVQYTKTLNRTPRLTDASEYPCKLYTNWLKLYVPLTLIELQTPVCFIRSGDRKRQTDRKDARQKATKGPIDAYRRTDKDAAAPVAAAAGRLKVRVTTDD